MSKPPFGESHELAALWKAVCSILNTCASTEAAIKGEISTGTI